ncbi:MAG TPA: sortase [Anaerolineae bacterium]|nr:sortase [Anaerolineae bacterium]
MSRFLTPPEPVAWDSRQSAAPLNLSAAKHLVPLRCTFEALVWACFWLIKSGLTITLGWFRSQSAISFFVNINQQTQFTPLNLLPRTPSCNHKHCKISLLILFNFGIMPLSLQLAQAEVATPTIPTRLLIPDIALDSAVVPVGWKRVEVDGKIYGQWKVEDNLVGWHNLSARLGQIGNSVLNGHSNVYARVFRNLGQVEIGDMIIVFSNNQTYYYTIAQKVLVQEKGVSTEKRLENAKFIQPTEDERLTLITCARPGATHRLIVIAYPDVSYKQ